MLTAKPAETEKELLQILQLQQQYLAGHNSSEEEKEQGFVTVHHTLQKLKQLHALAPSVIVKDKDEVIAYALVMLNKAGDLIPELFSMFQMLKTLSYRDKLLSAYSYYVMGQICVDKPYRGQGVFQMLYDKHKKLMQPHYDFVLTEIATRNTRSIRAHEKVGFELLHRFKDEKEEWDVVIWNWR
ncbi:MAG: GNAT family N-acetyltransferase [Chitinophagaceae bacterium]|nr:GNAT family N-acetyltransferase [Chitinophagaceae bacterium]